MGRYLNHKRDQIKVADSQLNLLATFIGRNSNQNHCMSNGTEKGGSI